MSNPSRDPSIEDEPQFRGVRDLGDELGGEPVYRFGPVDPVDDVEHSVWDEPTRVAQAEGADAPEGELTYARWLTAGIDGATWRWSWAITVLIACAAGPWGIIGAFATASAPTETTLFGLLGATVLAPVTEEITKVAALLWVVEKRPFWLKSMTQLLVCSAVGGLVFAVIENVVYLNVYNPGGGESYANWRWTVCTALHVNCSVIAGFGLVRIWDKAVRTRTRPELRLGTPFFALAMITHGLYNFGATLAETFGWLEF